MSCSSISLLRISRFLTSATSSSSHSHVARLTSIATALTIKQSRLFTSSSTRSLSSTAESKAQRLEVILAEASKGNPSAICDLGWSFHQGLSPASNGIPDIQEAIKQYTESAGKGYPPACSLLGDLYFYGLDINQDYEAAREWLQKVIELTSAEEAGDAYIRSKSLQKLGVIAHLTKSPFDDDAVSSDLFTESIDLGINHLKGGYAFLLSHDPPGLWENLSHEGDLLRPGDDDVKTNNLNKGLDRMVSSGQEHENGETLRWRWVNEDSEKRVATLRSLLHPYTASVRAKENDKEWLLKYQIESLNTFPGTTGGAWGITYFHSFFRVWHSPLIQHALRSKLIIGADPTKVSKPKIVVLGSALGTSAVWPALAFGIKAVGFELLPCCVTASSELAAKLYPVMKHLHKEEENKGEASKVAEFRCVNVTDSSVNSVVEEEMKDATVVWSNDYSWPIESQKEVEALVLKSLPVGGILVLYRKPHSMDGWNEESIGKVVVATSWNPKVDMYVLKKV